jgi:hypothetical protein
MKLSGLHNPKAAARAIEDFKRRFTAKECLSPSRDCSGPIISAHTLSAEAMLRPISRDGHVYSLKFDLYSPPDQTTASLVLRGIRDTSVFNGFCAKHDKRLFSPIENQQFNCTPEQVFLHAYRAVAKEAYLKRKQAEGLISPEAFKDIHGLTGPYEFSEQALIHQALSLRGAEEIERLKSRLDAAFLHQDFRRIMTTVVPFASTPKIVTSFVYGPDLDFQGNELQDFADLEHDLAHLIVTMLPAAFGGVLLLSHEDTAGSAPRKLIESFCREADTTSAAIWLVACQTENFALSPSWYESWTTDAKQAFDAAFNANCDPFEGTRSLLPQRRVSFDDWGAGKPFTV